MQNSPLSLAQISNKVNLDCTILKEHLEFLIRQGMIEERTFKKGRSVFAIMERGKTVLGYFQESMQVLPVLDEESP
jgi:predicted ArsR family transcriptional regulator